MRGVSCLAHSLAVRSILGRSAFFFGFRSWLSCNLFSSLLLRLNKSGRAHCLAGIANIFERQTIAGAKMQENNNRDFLRCFCSANHAARRRPAIASLSISVNKIARLRMRQRRKGFSKTRMVDGEDKA
jgi:hypothetical protein